MFEFDIIAILALTMLFITANYLKIAINPLYIALDILTALMAIVVLVSVLHKGVVSLVTCILGVVLVSSSTTGLYFLIEGPSTISDNSQWHQYTDRIIQTGKGMNYLLGVLMMAFGIILGYKPSILFARNRPQNSEDHWQKYKTWHDGVLLEQGLTEPSVHVKSLMNDVDRALLWRYECILAEIYGDFYLVRTEGFVPKRATFLVRDRKSGRLVGKAKYPGYFV